MGTRFGTGGPSIIVEVWEKSWLALIPEAIEACRRSAEAALSEEGFGNIDCEVSIVLEADEYLRALNLKWRGIDRPTDVLSFGDPPSIDLGSAPKLLGDIVISVGVASRDAEIDRIPIHDHLCHLVVHGIFHLLGYDHERETDASVMEAKEAKVLKALGVPDPFASLPGVPILDSAD